MNLPFFAAIAEFFEGLCYSHRLIALRIFSEGFFYNFAFVFVDYVFFIYDIVSEYVVAAGSVAFSPTFL